MGKLCATDSLHFDYRKCRRFKDCDTFAIQQLIEIPDDTWNAGIQIILGLVHTFSNVWLQNVHGLFQKNLNFCIFFLVFAHVNVDAEGNLAVVEPNFPIECTVPYLQDFLENAQALLPFVLVNHPHNSTF